jgi:apolipoprotein D and lipocalin family protein
MDYSRRMRLLPVIAALLTMLSASLANAETAPLPVPQQGVNLQRYTGDWYVQGYIPLRIPLFSDAEARNYTEHYELLTPDTIRMTSEFDDGANANGERRSFSFKGNVIDTTLNATWKIWFLWPVGAKYSIIYLDESYATTIVASANRRLAWIMSREQQISDTKYMELISFLGNAGFDPEKFRRVPHENNRVAQLN